MNRAQEKRWIGTWLFICFVGTGVGVTGYMLTSPHWISKLFAVVLGIFLGMGMSSAYKLKSGKYDEGEF